MNRKHWQGPTPEEYIAQRPDFLDKEGTLTKQRSEASEALTAWDSANLQGAIALLEGPESHYLVNWHGIGPEKALDKFGHRIVSQEISSARFDGREPSTVTGAQWCIVGTTIRFRSKPSALEALQAIATL